MEGRVALVTGAGRGIGRATALLLASRGARVLGVSRTAEELDALAREAPIEVLVESVATTGGCARIVAEAERRLGPMEMLVNNAGVGSRVRLTRAEGLRFVDDPQPSEPVQPPQLVGTSWLLSRLHAAPSHSQTRYPLASQPSS